MLKLEGALPNLSFAVIGERSAVHRLSHEQLETFLIGEVSAWQILRRDRGTDPSELYSISEEEVSALASAMHENEKRLSRNERANRLTKLLNRDKKWSTLQPETDALSIEAVSQMIGTEFRSLEKERRIALKVVKLALQLRPLVVPVWRSDLFRYRDGDAVRFRARSRIAMITAEMLSLHLSQLSNELSREFENRALTEGCRILQQLFALPWTAARDAERAIVALEAYCKELHQDLGIPLSKDMTDNWRTFLAAAANAELLRAASSRAVHNALLNPLERARVEADTLYTLGHDSAVRAALAPVVLDPESSTRSLLVRDLIMRVRSTHNLGVRPLLPTSSNENEVQSELI